MRYTKGEKIEFYRDLDIPKDWVNETIENNPMASFKYSIYRIWVKIPEDHKDWNKEYDTPRFWVSVFEDESQIWEEDAIQVETFDSLEKVKLFITKNQK